ncbi:MAG: DNA-directed RNA polymerase subunit H [Methanobacteriota archaeon]|nr:MAG: DNA-directed RNA polymerase subunit H [Euryarchaeota archaeon]
MLGKKKFVDILAHELVPEHILLSEEEKKSVLENLRIKPAQLPLILESDPAARAINAKPGDIIKIIRKSPTAGTSVAYRYVIKES